MQKPHYTFSLLCRQLCIAMAGILALLLANCTTVHTNMQYDNKSKTNKASRPYQVRSGIPNSASKCPCKDVQEGEIVGAALEDEEVVEGGDFEEVGLASWYGRDFDGKATASGEIFNSRKLSAAHKSLPLGTMVLVRNLENDKEVILKINDRGPFIEGRIIDISEYGAEVLDFKEEGLTQVGIKIIRKAKKGSSEGTGATADFFQNKESAKKKRWGSNAVLPDAGQEYYSVQVGAFNELRHAQKLERNLEVYAQPIEVRHNQSDGSYLVRLGRFPSRLEAEQMAYTLEADGYKAFIREPY